MLIVTTNPNLPDIVRFGHYCPLRFVLGDHACPQNTSNKSATSTTNKGSYQILTRRCEILQSTLLKSRHNRTASKVGSDTKCHSLAQPARYCPFWALRPSWIFFLLPHMASKRVWQISNQHTTNKVSYQILTRRYEILH